MLAGKHTFATRNQPCKVKRSHFGPLTHPGNLCNPHFDDTLTTPDGGHASVLRGNHCRLPWVARCLKY